MLTFLIAARIVANPVSNVFQKRLASYAANPLFVIAGTHALLTVPCLLLIPWTVPPSPGFWGNICIAAALAVSSNVLLVYALRSGDLSMLGPINAYKAFVSLALGIFILGEVPTVLGLSGMLLILAGSFFVLGGQEPDAAGPRRRRVPGWVRDPGVRFRFAALALSATEAVFLKRALLLSSPLTAFVLWSILGLPIAGGAIAVVLRQQVPTQSRVLRTHLPTLLWLGATTGIMQLTTLLTFGRLQVGPSLALFQLSSVISVLLGYRYFQEQHVRRRLFGALVMVAGAALIVAKG